MSRYYWRFGPASLAQLTFVFLGCVQAMLGCTIMFYIVTEAIEDTLPLFVCHWALSLLAGLFLAVWVQMGYKVLKEQLVKRPRREGMV